MRKYKEFQAVWITATNGMTGEHTFANAPLTFDLYSVVSFSRGTLRNHTTVRLADGSAFDLLITYRIFSEIMQKEVPDLLHSFRQS